MRTYYSLYGRLLFVETLKRAFEKVKRSKGAPGLDNQTPADFNVNLGKELNILLCELKEKSYHATPVKRGEISKADGGI